MVATCGRVRTALGDRARRIGAGPMPSGGGADQGGAGWGAGGTRSGLHGGSDPRAALDAQIVEGDRRAA